MIYYLTLISPFKKYSTNLYFQIEVAADSSHANVPRARTAQAFRGASHLCQKTGACELTENARISGLSPGIVVFSCHYHVSCLSS